MGVCLLQTRCVGEREGGGCHEFSGWLERTFLVPGLCWGGAGRRDSASGCSAVVGEWKKRTRNVKKPSKCFVVGGGGGGVGCSRFRPLLCLIWRVIGSLACSRACSLACTLALHFPECCKRCCQTLNVSPGVRTKSGGDGYFFVFPTAMRNTLTDWNAAPINARACCSLAYSFFFMMRLDGWMGNVYTVSSLLCTSYARMVSKRVFFLRCFLLRQSFSLVWTTG